MMYCGRRRQGMRVVLNGYDETTSANSEVAEDDKERVQPAIDTLRAAMHSVQKSDCS